jgi:hypothetical protein
MLSVTWMLLATCTLFAALASPAPLPAADDEPTAPAFDLPGAKAEASKPATEKAGAPAAKHLLRYKFRPGETLRWEVEQRSEVRTTVSGTTQTAETSTASVKIWKVTDVTPEGNVKFVYSVDSVDMRQKLTGRQEVRYNSKTDKEPPAGFQDAAKSVGVPLTTFTMDPTGKIVDRTEHLARAASQSLHPAIPLPEEAVEIGHRWSYSYDAMVTTRDRSVKKVQMRQQMKLEEVKNGIAIISADTQILSPVRQDPTIEAQLVQSESIGKVRFDLDAGRVTSVQTDLDKHVVGFQGDASSLHCVTRFSEKLLPAEITTAAAPKPIAGPAPRGATSKPVAAPSTAAPRQAVRRTR